MSPIRQAIYNRLKSVSSIGKVHPYQRYATRNKQLEEMYVWTDPDTNKHQLRGWFIRRENWGQTIPASCIERTTRWGIQGFMALDDESESELIFDQLLDDIETAFRADGTLGGVISGIGNENEWGLQLQDSGPYMFAGVLCHGAKLRLITRH